MTRVIVCNRAGVPSAFTDNVDGVCWLCAHRIYYRPYMPAHDGFTICMECFVENAPADVELQVLSDSIRELQDLTKRDTDVH